MARYPSVGQFERSQLWQRLDFASFVRKPKSPVPDFPETIQKKSWLLLGLTRRASMPPVFNPSQGLSLFVIRRALINVFFAEEFAKLGGVKDVLDLLVRSCGRRETDTPTYDWLVRKSGKVLFIHFVFLDPDIEEYEERPFASQT